MGAIIGGAVGGFAVLALIVGVIIYFCVRGKRRERNPTPSHPPPAPNMTSTANNAPLPANSVYGVTPSKQPTGIYSSATLTPPVPDASTLPSTIPIVPPYHLAGSPSSFTGHVQYSHPPLPSLQQHQQMYQHVAEMSAGGDAVYDERRGQQRPGAYEMAGEGAGRRR